MRDLLLVNVGHSRQYLLHVLLYLFHTDPLIFLLVLLNLIFEIFATILKNEVLRRFSIFWAAVVDVKHLHNILAVAKFVEYFVFPAHILPSLLRSLDCDCLTRFLVMRLKHITKGAAADDSLGVELSVCALLDGVARRHLPLALVALDNVVWRWALLAAPSAFPGVVCLVGGHALICYAMISLHRLYNMCFILKIKIYFLINYFNI